MTDLVKVLIIDDHPTFLEGFSLIIKNTIPDSTILNALNGKEALSLLEKQTDIDWIFLDVNLPDINGIKLIARFNDNKVTANIVIVSSADKPQMIDQILKHHASGFLTKDFDRHLLAQCIDTIEQGGIFLTKRHSQQLNNYRDSVLKEKNTIKNKMSLRQQQILLLVAKGYSNQEIATSLNLSESTIKTHVSTLIALFDSDNRTHCAAEARRLDFIQ